MGNLDGQGNGTSVALQSARDAIVLKDQSPPPLLLPLSSNPSPISGCLASGIGLGKVFGGSLSPV